MFYNSASSSIQELPERHTSALRYPIKKKICALKNSKAFLAQISQVDTGATWSCAWCHFRLFPNFSSETPADQRRLWAGHLPSSHHTQGDSLGTTAKWELIPGSWKFSQPKPYSSINRLCSLCSSFRGGCRSGTEGEWPQTWGIPLFCL